MRPLFKAAPLGLPALAPPRPSIAQVKQTREQIMFYTSDWKGERFPDGQAQGAGRAADARARCLH